TLLGEWFKREAMRVYGQLEESAQSAERRDLAEIIRQMGGTVTARDLQRRRRKYAGKGGAEAAERDLLDLVSCGWGEWLPVACGDRTGAVTKRFRLDEWVDS